MSKYNFNVLFMVLALLFVSCDNLVNSKNDDSYNSNTEITDNVKFSSGWYSYLTDNDENYSYIKNKGSVTISGTTERFTSQVMESLYHIFYHNETSITKTENGFILSLGENSMDFFSTVNIPEWCSSFEYF